ncbi:hypothetical protein FAM21809_02447 [Lentilactobacillus parabuchneri]|nr:hypothetical protein FAM21809_02447 [Lentilactobacillus parabuchneri]
MKMIIFVSNLFIKKVFKCQIKLEILAAHQ